MANKHSQQINQQNAANIESCYDFPKQIPAPSMILQSCHTTGKGTHIRHPQTIPETQTCCDLGTQAQLYDMPYQ